MQSFPHFGVPTDPLGMLFKWRLWCSRAESQLPEISMLVVHRPHFEWQGNDISWVGGPGEPPMKEQTWRRITSKQDGKRTTWFERQPSQRCKYRDTMSKGKVFRIEEIPAHEAPAHYSQCSQPFRIVDGKHFGECSEKKNVLTAINYEALTHFSSLTQIMLRTWKTAIGSVPSFMPSNTRDQHFYSLLPPRCLCTILIRSFPKPKNVPWDFTLLSSRFCLWKTSQERVKPKAISFHCFYISAS